MNIGFVVTCSHWSDESSERLIRAIAAGALGIVADEVPENLRRYCECFDLPIIRKSELSAWGRQPKTLLECAMQTVECAEQFRISSRNMVKLGAAADLLLIAGDTFTASLADDLHRVLVAGNVVYDQGKLTGAAPGVLLTREPQANRRRQPPE